MTAPSEAAMNDQMADQDDAGMPDRIPVLAGPPLTGDLPAAHARVWPQSAAAAGSPAQEPENVSASDAGRSMTSAQPGSVPEAPAASVTASLTTRWQEIQVMFVDDPRTSAELAAALVDDNIRAIISSVKEQQDSLFAAWHGQNAGTEELRTAVQHYRAFGNRLAEFSRET